MGLALEVTQLDWLHNINAIQLTLPFDVVVVVDLQRVELRLPDSRLIESESTLTLSPLVLLLDPLTFTTFIRLWVFSGSKDISSLFLLLPRCETRIVFIDRLYGHGQIVSITGRTYLSCYPCFHFEWP